MAANKLPTFDSAPPDELGLFKHHFSITMEIEHHPLMAAMAIVAVFLIIAYLFGSLAKKNQAASAIPAEPLSTDSQTGQPYILTSGANPLPVVVTNPVTSPVPVTPVPTQPPPVTTPPANTAFPTPYVVTKSAGAILASRPGGTNNGGVNITTIPKNTKVHVTGAAQSFKSNHYYPVVYNGTSGFVNTNAVGSLVYN